MKRIGTIAGTLLAALFLSPCAWGQATVDESLETAFIYVDPNGSDSNPGTQALPLQTIGKAAQIAIANNQNGIGTRVTINPGTYRESILMAPTPTDTSLPITFEAATNGTVIDSGSVLYTGWQPYSGNTSIFTNAWPNQWGLCPANPTGPLEQDIVLRREMVIVNGTHLTQVLSLTEMLPGTFYADEAGATIYVWPPAGTDMSTATVEVPTLDSLFSIFSRNDIVLRGLTFQYSNGCRTSPAVTVSGSAANILFDTDSFVWNNSLGLSILNPASNFTVQNSVANHNGVVGFHSFEAKNGLWQSDQASYNNWRGVQGAYYAWNRSGANFYSEHNSTYTGLTVLFNQTHGIHWDTDNANITASSILASQNLLNAVFTEKNEGPLTISSSNLCDSNIGVNTQYLYGGSLTLRNSEFVTLTGSTLLNSGISQVNVQGQAGGISITNWETGQAYNLVTQNLTLTQNVIEGTASSQQVFSDSYLDGSDWTAFQTTLASNNNTWWNASNTSAFLVPSPNPGTSLSFSGWQSATGQDSSSTFAAPPGSPGAACSVTPEAPDYWFIIDNGSQTLTPAGTAVFNVSVIPFSFSGTVNLSFDGINEVPGLSATLSPATINTSGTSALTIAASTATAPGTYPVTILANSGSLTRTVTASLVVPSTSVRFSTASLAFGPQQVNTTSLPQTATLTNTGASALSITSITASGTFSETSTCGLSVAAGASCTISVTFTPVSTGIATGNVTIIDSDPTSPQAVSLTGTGTAPAVSLSPASLSFANQLVGTPSTAQTVTLQNTGTATLNIAGFVLAGTNGGDFAQANACGAVAAGASCTITVTFTPTATGTRTASVSITDNATGSPQTISLTGTGIAPAVSLLPASLSFASQLVSTTSAAQIVTLQNTGSATLNVDTLLLAGANKADFAQTNTCFSGAAAGTSCTITVTFTPTATGTRTASVSITDNATGSPQTISLTGTGIAPAVSLSPASLSFANQLVGTTSTAQTGTLQNTGSATLSIASFVLTGTNGGDFVQTNTCGGAVAAGASCTITVMFTPTATGARTGSLGVTDNATASPQTISLTGTGVAPAVSLSATSESFGIQLVRTTSATITVTLTNTGSGALNITSIALAGTNPGDFAQTNTCGTSVAAGAACSVSLTFTPTAHGTRSATVNITDNATGSPQSITVTGTGTAVTLSKKSLTFGAQKVGTKSPPQTVTFTNSGKTLAITSITITGTDSADFTETNTCGKSVATSCTITVTFAPKKTGTRTATVNIADSDPTSPQTITLTGTGK